MAMVTMMVRTKMMKMSLPPEDRETGVGGREGAGRFQSPSGRSCRRCGLQIIRDTFHILRSLPPLRPLDPTARVVVVVWTK